MKLRFVRAPAAMLAAACLFAAAVASAQDANDVPLTPDQQVRINESKARTAEAQALAAELGAEKAARDLAPGSGIAGTVTAGEGAGQVEASMLSALALQDAARCITARIRPLPEDISKLSDAQRSAAQRRAEQLRRCPERENLEHPPQSVLLVVGENPINLTLAQAYDIRQLMARRALTAAIRDFCDRDARDNDIDDHGICDRTQLTPEMTFMALEATTMSRIASLGMEAAPLINLLSYFRSNYTVGGVNVSGQDDALLMTAVASELLAQDVQAITATGGPNSAVISRVGRDIEELNALRLRANEPLDILKARLSVVRAGLNENTPADVRQRVEQTAAPYVQLSTRLTTAVGSFDDFHKMLFDSQGGALPSIGPVLQALSLEHTLIAGNGQVLWVRLNSSTGGYYTASNIWTFIGDVPIHYAGGVVVSYRLIQFSNGELVDAGLVPMFSGHVRAGDVDDRLPGAEERRRGVRRPGRRH